MVEPVVYEKDKFEKTRWGWWKVITDPVECEVSSNIIECQKHIGVEPNASLSLQIHKGRAEVYHGLEGITKVCVNGEIFDLGKNDKIFLPQGCLHFSWNEGATESVFHETQQGLLCDELDIKRAADKYKSAAELDSDDEVITMMIDVCKNRYDAGERAVYDFKSDNPNMERIANADLLNIYMQYKDEPKTLWTKMDDVLQKCKKLHAELTPSPKAQPKQVCQA